MVRDPRRDVFRRDRDVQDFVRDETLVRLETETTSLPSTKTLSQHCSSHTSVCTQVSDLCTSPGGHGTNEVNFSVAISSKDRLGSSLAAGEPSVSAHSSRQANRTASPRKLVTSRCPRLILAEPLSRNNDRRSSMNKDKSNLVEGGIADRCFHPVFHESSFFARKKQLHVLAGG